MAAIPPVDGQAVVRNVVNRAAAREAEWLEQVAIIEAQRDAALAQVDALEKRIADMAGSDVKESPEADV